MNTLPYPMRTLFWETTLRCNARCEFCGSGCGDCMDFPDELTTDEICSALSDVAKAFDPHDIMLNITGGEPLLRRDLFTVAEFASGLGFPWGMVTNGSLITPEIIEKMETVSTEVGEQTMYYDWVYYPEHPLTISKTVTADGYAYFPTGLGIYNLQMLCRTYTTSELIE